VATIIKIRSKRKGFRRGGKIHSDRWTSYSESDFTEEQLAAIQSDPMLTVEIEEKKRKYTRKKANDDDDGIRDDQ
jgi:hypothetical protein